MEVMNRVTIQASQNILDVCLQEYGSLEHLWDFHADNGFGDFPAALPAGYPLMVFPEKITENKRTVAILQPYCPGTGTKEYVSDSLFHDGYLHPDNYLYLDSYLLD